MSKRPTLTLREKRRRACAVTFHLLNFIAAGMKAPRQGNRPRQAQRRLGLR